MDIIKCENNHYYDRERFDKCPHCAKRKEIEIANEESRKTVFSLLANRKKQKENTPEDESMMNSWIFEDNENTNSSSGNLDNSQLFESMTRGYLTIDDNQVFEPVVGWLVCTNGLYKGKSFELHIGSNRIGRDESCEVCLSLDNSVSYRNHLTISFEPNEKKFYAIPGNKEAKSFLNGEVVNSLCVVGHDNELTIGENTFTLIVFDK